MSRHTLLGLSIAVSTAAYATLFAMAPRVALRDVHAPLPPIHARLYPVQFRQAVPEPPKPKAGPAPKRSTGPGKIEDLLKRETETLTPLESALSKPVDVPRISDRVASEGVTREHALTPGPEVLAKIDAKIIEIAENSARQNIEIARRLVTPSPDRIVGENEFPTLRAPSDANEESLSFGNLPVVSLIGEPTEAPSGGAPQGEEAPRPPYEEGVVLPQPEIEKPPSLPELDVIARAPIVEQIRKENPYEFMDDLIDMQVETYVPPNEKTGFFRLRISPKKGEDVPVLPKDVTFVIDASNSILQRKLDATAKAVKAMVAQLKPEDRFNIVIFRETATLFHPDRVPGTPENKAEADSFLTGIQSRGQTDVYDALRTVIQTPPRSGVPGVVVVMTDGRPTAGVRDPRTIINDLTAQNIQGNTIFAYGAGGTVNRYLLDLLAYRNKGESRVDPQIEAISQGLPDFFNALDAPILVSLHSNYGRIDQGNVFPKDIPDFYKGRAATIYGRFDPAKDTEFSMRLTGTAESRKKEIIFKANLRKAATGDEKIARMWAFQRTYYLIGEICRLGDRPELLAEIQQLSKKYNIRTSYSQ